MKNQIGLYGKLPARGDFVQRNLPRSFTDPWDDWQQQAIASSREQLGEQWLRCYLTSPVWHFALSTGLCGDQAAAGVMIPSVDRVGRYFPLSIAALLPAESDLLALLETNSHWFSQAESLILQGLDDHLDFEQFTGQMIELGLPQITQRQKQNPVPAERWYCALSDLALLGQIRSKMTPLLLQQAFADYSLWWTHGSEHVSSCLLVSRGLPTSDAYAALLSGQWQQGGWLPVSLGNEQATSELSEEL